MCGKPGVLDARGCRELTRSIFVVCVCACLCVTCLQLASVVLKQYVETHWTHLAEKFQEPELSETVCVNTHTRTHTKLAVQCAGLLIAKMQEAIRSGGH